MGEHAELAVHFLCSGLIAKEWDQNRWSTRINKIKIANRNFYSVMTNHSNDQDLRTGTLVPEVFLAIFPQERESEM